MEVNCSEILRDGDFYGKNYDDQNGGKKEMQRQSRKNIFGCNSVFDTEEKNKWRKQSPDGPADRILHKKVVGIVVRYGCDDHALKIHNQGNAYPEHEIDRPENPV